MKLSALGAVAAVSMLSGCAAPLLLGPALGAGGAAAGYGIFKGAGKRGATANMPRATAIAINQGIDPKDIQVSDVHMKATRAEWIADTPVGRYSCSSDDMLRSPYCVKL